MLLAVKLQNAVRKAVKSGTLSFHLKQIRVNSNVLGCSGFIQLTTDGIQRICYVNTERGLLNSYLFRRASSVRDYVGQRNQSAKTVEELVEGIVAVLTTDNT